MTGKGVVVKTDFKIATVRIRKSSACGHDCGECRACGGAEFLATVTNSVGAKVGDTVIIGAPSGKVLAYSFLLYILPILGAAVCYAVSGVFFSKPFFRTLCIVIWFTVWFFAVRRINRRVKMSTILGVADEKD